MKLNVWAFAIAGAIMWGLGVFLVTLWIILFEGETGQVTMLGYVYRGYSISYTGAFIGLIWAVCEGFIGGLIFAWIYNACAGTNRINKLVTEKEVNADKPQKIQLGPEVQGYDRIKHLGLIQGVINRFSAITLTMKSLATTVAAGLAGVAFTQNEPSLLKAAVIAIVFFGICDCFYSKRSSLHWKLFNRVAKGLRKTNNYNIYIGERKNYCIALQQICHGLKENPIIVFYYVGLILAVIYGYIQLISNGN